MPLLVDVGLRWGGGRGGGACCLAQSRSHAILALRVGCLPGLYLSFRACDSWCCVRGGACGGPRRSVCVSGRRRMRRRRAAAPWGTHGGVSSPSKPRMQKGLLPGHNHTSNSNPAFVCAAKLCTRVNKCAKVVILVFRVIWARFVESGKA